MKGVKIMKVNAMDAMVGSVGQGSKLRNVKGFKVELNKWERELLEHRAFDKGITPRQLMEQIVKNALHDRKVSNI